MMPRSMKLLGHATLMSALAVATLVLSSPSQAQRSGPFAHFNGSWAGGGTLTLSSGVRERIRCRASYAVDGGGTNLRLDLRCASDSYRFELTASATHSGDEISGTWSETSRGAGGTLSGQASGSRINIRATGQTFSALLSMSTTPGKQQISIQSPGSELSSISISLSKG
jgi:hypothetical protein